MQCPRPGQYSPLWLQWDPSAPPYAQTTLRAHSLVPVLATQLRACRRELLRAPDTHRAAGPTLPKFQVRSMGTQNRFILQPTRPAPYTGTLKPPVHTQTSSLFLCVMFVVHTTTMAHPPHHAQHTEDLWPRGGACGWGEGQMLEKCIPGQRLHSSARAPFAGLNGPSAPA